MAPPPAVHENEAPVVQSDEEPVSSESELQLELNAESRKWAETFDPGDALSDEERLVEPLMFTEGGVVVEEVMWNAPAGTTDKNGKGTRGAASSTSATTELL